MTAIRELKGHASNVSSLVVVNDTLYSASKDKTIKQWNLKTGECLRTFTGHTRWVRSLSCGSQHLYSGSFDDTVRSWDLSTGESDIFTTHSEEEGPSSKSHTLGVNAVWLDEKHGRLFSGSDDCSIGVWDLESREQIGSHGGFGVFGAVTALICSEDGETLYSAADDGGVHVWDTTTMEAVDVLTGHAGAVTALALVGNTLYSCGHDGSIVEWDGESAQRLRTFKAHTHEVLSLAVYAPKGEGDDSKVLFSGSWDGTVRSWNLSTGECTGLLKAHASRSVNAICTASLSDGTDVLITGLADGTIKLWNPTDLPKPSAPAVATHYNPSAAPHFHRPAPAQGPPVMYAPGPAVYPSTPFMYMTPGVPPPIPVGGPNGGGPQICTFYMRGNCRFGASCRNLHPVQ